MNGIEITFSRKYAPYSISTAESRRIGVVKEVSHARSQKRNKCLVYESGID